jgi:hypothetical protein
MNCLFFALSSWRVVSLVPEAFLLEVSLFNTVEANDIQVPGATIFDLAIVVSGAVGVLLWQVTIVAGMVSGHLFKIPLSEVVPDDVVDLIWLELSFDRGDLLPPFMVVLDGFQLSGQLQALRECVFLGF